MYGLLGLLLTSGENVKSAAPLEVYFTEKEICDSILILPNASVNKLIFVFIKNALN